jgi:HEAT repeat protein
MNIDLLLADLGSLDEAIAQKAEASLIRCGSPAIERTLALADDPRPTVRFRVAWILGKSCDPQALPVLIALTEDLDERVRYDATLALGELRCEGALPTLLRLARKTDDLAQVASAARVALRKLRGVVSSSTTEKLKITRWNC